MIPAAFVDASLPEGSPKLENTSTALFALDGNFCTASHMRTVKDRTAPNGGINNPLQHTHTHMAEKGPKSACVFNATRENETNDH